MGIKKIESKETFRTSDGQEFQDEPAAEKHEEIISAKSAYESARDRYARILWETQITADGEAFKFGSRNYYYITSVWLERPQIVTVNFYLSSTYTFNDDDVLMIWHRDNIDHPPNPYKITDLYLSRDAAKRRLLEVKRERVKELQTEIDDAERRKEA